mmetsp:Transcript_32721/g.79598  ORF Transcript_32721/g.79598 Transcript_32721/m.79598 type:complete len:1066 (-) Transcript_32721:202-3399(-)
MLQRACRRLASSGAGRRWVALPRPRPTSHLQPRRTFRSVAPAGSSNPEPVASGHTSDFIPSTHQVRSDAGPISVEELRAEIAMVEEKLAKNENVFELEGLCLDLSENQMNEEMTDLLHILMKYRVNPPSKIFNIMLNAFSKGGRILEVYSTINYMRACNAKANVVTFNTLMQFYANQMMFDMMLEVYEQMRSFNVNPDIITYNIMLNALAKSGQDEQAERMVGYIKERQLRPNESTYNIMIDMYSRMGNVKRMEDTFDGMVRSGNTPDVKTFTSMLKAHVDSLNVECILDIVERMLSRGVKPNMKTFTLAFKACMSANETEATLKLFRKINEAGKGDAKAMQETLQAGLEFSKNPRDHLKLFNEMISMGYEPEIKTYNLVLRKLAYEHEYECAKSLYEQIKARGVRPNKSSFSFLLKAIPMSVEFGIVESILSEMEESGIPFDHHMFQLVVKRLVKQQDSKRLLEQFEKFTGPRGVRPSAEIVSTIMDIYKNMNQNDEVVKLYNKLQELGVEPNKGIFTTTLHAMVELDIKLVPGLIKDIESIESTQMLGLLQNVQKVVKDGFARFHGDMQREAHSILKGLYEKHEIRPEMIFFSSLLKTYCRRAKAIPIIDNKNREEVENQMANRTQLFESLVVCFRLIQDTKLVPGTPDIDLAAECIAELQKGGLPFSDISSALSDSCSPSDAMSQLFFICRINNGDASAIMVKFRELLSTGSPIENNIDSIQSLLEKLKENQEMDRIMEFFRLMTAAQVPPTPSWVLPVLEGVVHDVERPRVLPTRVTFELQALLRLRLNNPSNPVFGTEVPLTGEFCKTTQMALKVWLNKSPSLSPLSIDLNIDRELGHRDFQALQEALNVYGMDITVDGKCGPETIDALHCFVRATLPESEGYMIDEPLPLTRHIITIWDYIAKAGKEHADQVMYMMSFTALERDTSKRAELMFVRLFDQMRNQKKTNGAAWSKMISYLIKRKNIPRVVKLYGEMRSEFHPPGPLVQEIVECLSAWKYDPDVFLEAFGSLAQLKSVPSTKTIEQAKKTFHDRPHVIDAIARILIGMRKQLGARAEKRKRS